MVSLPFWHFLFPSTISSSSFECLVNQRQYDKALPMCEKCFEKHKLVLGEDHPETLESMNLLVNVYCVKSEYKRMHLLTESYCAKGEFIKSIILGARFFCGAKNPLVAPFPAVQILWKGFPRAVQILWKRCTIRNVMIMAYAFLSIFLLIELKNRHEKDIKNLATVSCGLPTDFCKSCIFLDPNFFVYWL